MYTLGDSERVVQFSEQEILDADVKLNRLLVQSVYHAGTGLLTGGLLSVFFKNKIGIIGYTGGFALGLAIHKNGSGLIKHILK
ncbi:hypothetical protein pb186bvf_010057 [Paramecium bursaria]